MMAVAGAISLWVMWLLLVRDEWACCCCCTACRRVGGSAGPVVNPHAALQGYKIFAIININKIVSYVHCILV